MKYIDLIWILNWYLDFFLLYMTGLILKLNLNMKRIIIASLLGSLSTILVFFKVSNIFLVILKIFLAFVMCLVSFGYKNLKFLLNNFIYFYMISIILGGFIYYLNLSFKETKLGIYLINKKININIIVLLLSPFILFIYKKYLNKLKVKNKLIYNISIKFSEDVYNLRAYLDTGNKLVDPITGKPVILVAKNIINTQNRNFFYVPFNSIGGHNLLKCLKPNYILINNKKYNNYLVAIYDKKFEFDGVECILNNKLMEEM